MKKQMYYALAISRRWANTQKGERIIVQTMTSMTALAIVLGMLLIVG